ncbi:helix-turn-helix domain-containing protein [Flavobacterium sp.]|uniref:helix-turn-helix domain-containing protein n=1 Tax=Flavobacterium sp. TaxID=239 RepID=UPI0037506689
MLRETRGLSQDNIAIELGITQPSYARLEKDDERISITRLVHIAKVLKTSVSELIDEKTLKIINQQNSENPSAYVDSIINSDKDHIKTLKEEISFLRNLLKK